MGTVGVPQPAGWVFRIEGSDNLVQDVVIDGVSGIGIGVGGDRITIRNPTIRNSTNGGGVRVFSGRGFRCYGGDVATTDDAALQFSANDSLSLNDIHDGAFIGTQCHSVNGRLMLVGSTGPGIHDVRFIGITGEVTGVGDCIRVQNRIENRTRNNPIERVTFRDVFVSQTGSSYAVAIENEFVTLVDEGLVTDIAFLDVFVRAASDVGFITFAAAPASERPLRRVTWLGGGVGPASSGTAPSINLSRLDGGLFAGLRVAAGANRAAVVLGGEIDGKVADCRNVVLRDLGVDGVANGYPGVRFDQASHCGMVRGRVAQASGASAYGVKLSATAQDCYVIGTDLNDLSVTPKIQADAGATYRVRDCRGLNARLPAVTLGAGVAVNVTTGTPTAPVAGAIRLYNPGPGNFDVATLNGGALGDLAVLRRADTGAQVTAKDATGNLSLPADVPLSSADDTLSLLRTAAGWAALATSDNG